MTNMNSGAFHMAGTEGTGAYVVIAATARGRIGVRVLEGSIDRISRVAVARVRVEPAERPNVVESMAAVLQNGKWKQPGHDGQHRFSRVVTNGKSRGKSLRVAVTKGIEALGVGELKKIEVNPEAPKWAKDLVAKF